jgi:hypothetical protein
LIATVRPAEQASVDGGGGELTLADEMSEPAFQLGWTEPIGAAMMKARQVKDETDVGVDSALGLAVEREVVDEPEP